MREMLKNADNRKSKAESRGRIISFIASSIVHSTTVSEEKIITRSNIISKYSVCK